MLALLAALALRCAADPANPAEHTGTGTTNSSTTGTASSDPPTTGSSTAGDSGEATTTGAPCSDPARCPAACDTISQGCPRGHKCTGIKPGLHDPYAGTACVPDNADEGAPPGSICINAADGSDTCDATSMCMQFGSGEGACLAFCAGDPDAPLCDDPTMVCARIDHLWPVSACVPSCDPLAYDCPDAELAVSAMVCAPASVGFGCVLRGNLDGQPLGQPCLDHRDCIAAAHCAPPNTVPGCQGLGCCAAYCDLDAPSCPLSGQDCVPHFAPGTAPAGLEDVGLCAAPG